MGAHLRHARPSKGANDLATSAGRFARERAAGAEGRASRISLTAATGAASGICARLLLQLLVLQDGPVEHVVPLVPCHASGPRHIRVACLRSAAATPRSTLPPGTCSRLRTGATTTAAATAQALLMLFRATHCNKPLHGTAEANTQQRLMRRTFPSKQVAEQFAQVRVVRLVVKAQRAAVLEVRHELQRQPLAQHLRNASDPSCMSFMLTTAHVASQLWPFQLHFPERTFLRNQSVAACTVRSGDLAWRGASPGPRLQQQTQHRTCPPQWEWTSSSR